MLTDRYDLPVSTSSVAARDAYVRGLDRLLMLHDGVLAAFDDAIAADPGFALAHAARGHVLAMFAPSFFTGALVNRFGLYRIMMAGAVLFAASAGVVLSGLTFWHFYVGLILLGLAWNFLYIGATTLLTETYRPSEKAKMQAANDFLVFGTVAATAAGAGALQHAFGWATINWLSLPFVILAFVAVAWLAARPKTGAA